MKNVLILGANSDISQAIAHKFVDNGFDLILASRNSNKLLPLKKDLEIRFNTDIKILEFDALDFESHRETYDSLEQKPDVVACVFGYLGDNEKAIYDLGEARTILETNYNGAVSILNIVAEDFKKRKKGTIIGISSVAGERGRQSNFMYGSAKAGFTTYLDGLRNWLFPHKAHVITVKPGFVATAMTAGLDLPPLLTAKPQKVAKDIYKAFLKKKNTVYTLRIWRYIMFIIRNIPEFMFKKMKM